MSNVLTDKNEYTDPLCPFDNSQYVEHPSSIPMNRVTEKLDAYMASADYSAAEKHLNYWMAEAEASGDIRGKFSILNEQMGLYRKWEQKDKAFESAGNTIAMINEIGAGTVTAGTAYVNAGTVCEAFGVPGAAITMFENAERIYSSQLEDNDSRLGSLFNNMGTTLATLRRFGEAHRCFMRATEIMSKIEGKETDMAITQLNMVSAVEAEHGLDKAEAVINMHLDRAEELLNSPTLPRDSYHRFVCEKCIPAFQYYGRFMFAIELQERINGIDERP